MNTQNTLAKIQSLVKAPKGQFNNFGKYKYRSAEDIMEAVKPVINPLGFWLTVSDEVVLMGNRFYIKATATLTDGTNSYSTTSYAREEETKKGMDSSQITGSATSYARKMALSGLFCLDDSRDSDATNTHGNDDHSEFILELKNCKTMPELLNLYNQNKDSVESNASLKKLFAERKNEIK